MLDLLEATYDAAQMSTPVTTILGIWLRVYELLGNRFNGAIENDEDENSTEQLLETKDRILHTDHCSRAQ